MATNINHGPVLLYSSAERQLTNEQISKENKMERWKDGLEEKADLVWVVRRVSRSEI